MAGRYDDEVYDDELEDEMLDDELLDEDDEDNRKVVAGVSAWMISAGLHGLIALILGAIIFAGMQEEDPAPIRAAQMEPLPQDEKEPPEERELEPQDVEIVSDEISETPVVVDIEVPVEEIQTEDEIVTEVQQPKGREEANAVSEAGGAAAFNAMGAGGGASGAFGNRSGGGKIRALGRYGGSRRTENAVNAALRWFARHQGPDGRWSVDKYQLNCQDDPKCEPGQGHTGDHSDGDVACTGYALLCFLGAGFDHKTPSKFQPVVQKAVDYLVERIKVDGAGKIGKGRNYEIGVVAMALAEAYAMTLDPTLKQPAQDLMDVIWDRQLKEDGGYGLGWDYTKPKPTRVDMSVSGWCVMAAKSAAAGGLNVHGIMEGAKEMIDRAWKAANPDWEQLDPYDGQSGFPYTWDTTTDEVEKHETNNEKSRAPIGALMAVFLGRTQGDTMLETLCNYIADKQMPATYPTNTYYLYYNMLAIFQAGGDRWKEWNKVVAPMIVDSQRKGEGCYDGSWDWEDTRFHGSDTGRLLSTAYMTLSLQVYYRYVPVAELKKN